MNALTSCSPAITLSPMLADAGPFSLICFGETVAHDPTSAPVQSRPPSYWAGFESLKRPLVVPRAGADPAGFARNTCKVSRRTCWCFRTTSNGCA